MKIIKIRAIFILLIIFFIQNTINAKQNNNVKENHNHEHHGHGDNFEFVLNYENYYPVEEFKQDIFGADLKFKMGSIGNVEFRSKFSYKNY